MNKAQRKFGAADLRREVEKGVSASFYLLHGEEEFEREETCAWLIAALIPQQVREFNFDLLRGGECALADLLQVYNSYPVMADHRLVVLKGCEKLTVEECKGLEKIVDAPLETTIFIAVGGKIDLRRRLFKQLSQKGWAIEFKPPYDNQIASWLRDVARRKGMTIEAEAADLLHLLVGGNLRELAGELDKLRTYVGDRQAITRQAVEEAIGGSRNAGIFQFTDAIAARDRQKSLTMLHQLLDQGEAPLGIVAMICRHFQLLIKAQNLLGRGGVDRTQMAGELNIRPYFVDKYLTQVRHYPRPLLWSAMGALRQADFQLKSQGTRFEPLVMDLLVERLWASCQRSKWALTGG